MKFIKFAFAGTLVCVWILGALFYSQTSRPASDDPTQVTIDIPPGTTLRKISDQLFEKKLIKSPSAFRMLAYLKDKENQIQVGEFTLFPSMLPIEILTKITSGKPILHPVTIPEGYRITEIAKLLADRNLSDPKIFIEETRNKELIDSLGIPADSLEGYLFPETYRFSKYTSEKKIVQTMVEIFKERVLKLKYLKRSERLKSSFHEIITLASLIEKETGKDEERKQISAVFHNRLKKNMRLQTDPTVIYAIQDFDGNIRKKDLSIDSPYNTYKYRGLPPGPIANPGLKSIIAALFPTESDHLYFVSRKDGGHQFSTNLVDHNRAVRKYQLRKKRKRL